MSSGRLSAFPLFPFLRPRSQNERASWPETTATVADCACLTLSGRAAADGDHAYNVRFTYWVDGRMYSGCLKAHSRYSAGESLAVRYDPAHPERNSADPDERLRTELLVAASVVLIALYLLVHWR